MSLFERLKSDVKVAMRAGENLRRETLRMVLAMVQRKEIDEDFVPTDEGVQDLLRYAVKMRRDSAEQFAKAGREELAAKERAEIELLEVYLPQQLSEDETRAAAAAVVAELGLGSKKEMGRAMKELMARHPGTIDGKLAQRAVGELLS